MTLLSICQQVANSVPVAAPTSIVGNNDETAILLLAMAQDEGETLARRPQGGWLSMIREYTFTTAAIAQQAGTIANVGGFAVISGLANTAPITAPVQSWMAFGTGVPDNSIVLSATPSTVMLSQPATQTGAGLFVFGKVNYTLPADFQRPIDDTMWDRSRFWAMRGPLSPQQWQLYKSSVIGKASIQRRWRIREMAPTGDPNSPFTLFSIDPTPTDNGSALVFEYVSNAWCKSSAGTVQTSWQADSDIGIIDEFLIRLGVKWRYLRRLGMSYQDELSEYEYQVGKAMATDGGAPMLDVTPSDQLTLIGPWNLPETGFGNVLG